MSEIQIHTTGLTSQYIAQVTGDLECNVTDQNRITAEIESLQEQLGALQHDRSVLVSIQDALGGANAAGEADATATPTVPRQATAEPQQSKPKKATATRTKATASKTDTKPTLVNLIRVHLEQQSEPRSVTEITAALMQAHPVRGVRATVVRTTLEGLVAKSQAQRTKQGSSVLYTATKPATAKAQQEAVAG